MCGIAGLARGTPREINRGVLLRMAAALRHRGPDGFGLYAGDGVGFAHTRLSIIDLHGGAQPLTNEDGQVIVVFNGEIFNYLDLRATLQDLGHRFRTHSDTEVLAHGYEEWGPALIPRLNGEFAFAAFDRRKRELLLARDRFGIRPLYYATLGDDLLFASEAKAIFAAGELRAEPDYAGIDEVFTCWAARPPRTVFRGISALEPGTYARWKDGRLRLTRYYD
ncbi:MAG: asparagine synthetase B, partial [Gemmatimonadales bacterium]|nr:asparagine synthetase B [Gemmatimonadales bacterium]